MKNLLNYNSLFRAAVIMIAMAFMASQVPGTYAQGQQGNIQTKLDEIIAEVQKPPAGVPKTGQILTSEPGDDGELERGVTWPNPRFTDNLDGTITDNLTNLIWDKKANRFGAKDWSTALSDCNGLADGAADLTDGSAAGDWRLPNRFELESLLHMGFSGPAVPDTNGTLQWTEGDPFTDDLSPLWFSWSSTTRASTTTMAWIVGFFNGSVGWSLKESDKLVWCVQGGQ